MTMHSPQPMIYDITWPISSNVAPWPGDTLSSLDWVMRQADGNSVNLSRVTFSPHTGTHADAPYHYDSARETIDRVELTSFVGPARLVDVRGRSPIRPDDLGLERDQRTTRLLLRTGAWNNSHRFPETIPILHEDVPGYLQELGICLIGLDVPSVDARDSKQLPIHHALGSRGIHILEGLDLREPPPGVYELIALPLKIEKGCGAPVRAVLRQLRGGQ